MVTTSSFCLLLLLIPINQCSSVFIAPHALTNRIDYSAVNVTVPYTVVVSPDGLNVYTSFESQRGPNGYQTGGGLIAWSRDVNTGGLSNQIAYATDIKGLTNLIISPDGSRLFGCISEYAKHSDLIGRIFVWHRNTVTGALSNRSPHFVESKRGELTDWYHRTVSSMVVSRDSRFLYVCSGDTVLKFDIVNQLTALPDNQCACVPNYIKITNQDCPLLNNDCWLPEIATKIPLLNPRSGTSLFTSMIFSPDGKFLLLSFPNIQVDSIMPSFIKSYSIETSDGTIGDGIQYTSGNPKQSTNQNLHNKATIAMSSDGKNIYFYGKAGSTEAIPADHSYIAQ